MTNKNNSRFLQIIILITLYWTNMDNIFRCVNNCNMYCRFMKTISIIYTHIWGVVEIRSGERDNISPILGALFESHTISLDDIESSKTALVFISVLNPVL